MSISYPQTFRNMNAFFDGEGYAGRILDCKPPVVKIMTAQHRGGGMDGSVAQDVGMEAMTAEAQFAEWGPRLITAVGTRQNITFRTANKREGDPSVTGFVFTIGGLWTETDFGDLKPGNDAPMKLVCAVDLFRLSRDGEVHYDIDIKNYKRVIGGVDQLADLAAAMGV